MPTPIEELAETLDGIGAAVTDFKSHYDQRLDDIERKTNLQSVSGNGPTSLARYTSDERKALTSAFTCLIKGDQAAANRYFAEAAAEHPEFKAMQVGVDSQGGYVVSPEFSRETTRVMLETAPLLERVRMITLRSGDAFEEVEDLQSAEALWVGETSSRSDTVTPDIGKFRAELREIYAQPKATQKLIDTADIDVIAWLSDKVGEQFGNKLVTAVVSGDGVIQPRGILTYATATTADATRAWGTLQYIPTGASGAFHTTQFDPLQDVIGALKPQYRAGARWYMNRVTAAAARKLKDTTGRFLWTDALVEDRPSMLLGFPVVECEQMPDPAANSYSVMFANLSKGYTAIRGQGLKFLVDPYTDKPHVRLYGYQRFGGAVNNFESIKLLKFAAS